MNRNTPPRIGRMAIKESRHQKRTQLHPKQLRERIARLEATRAVRVGRYHGR